MTSLVSAIASNFQDAPKIENKFNFKKNKLLTAFVITMINDHIGSKDPSKRSLRVSNEGHARSNPRIHENIPPMRTNDSTVYRTTVKGHPTGNADLHNAL